MKTVKKMQDFLEIVDSGPISSLLLNDVFVRAAGGPFDLSEWANVVVSGAPGFVYHLVLRDFYSQGETISHVMSALVCGFSVKVGSFPVFRAQVTCEETSVIFFFFGPHDGLLAALASFLQKARKRGKI